MARILSALAAVAAVAVATTAITEQAAAQRSRARAGTLTCNIAPGVGFIVGSQKNLSCVYRHGRFREYYVGTMSRFGVDIGATTGGVLGWAVFAPTTLGRGALSGHYGGAGAQATVGVGAGVNVLIGGNNRTVTLQPVSVQGQRGLDVAAGVSSLDLSYASRR